MTNKHAIHYVFYEAYYNLKEFSITELTSDEHDILHWARMNKITRLNVDSWLITNYFDFANIMYTYHIENCESIIYDYELPVIVSFSDENYWKDNNKAQVRFDYKVEKYHE